MVIDDLGTRGGLADGIHDALGVLGGWSAVVVAQVHRDIVSVRSDYGNLLEVL